METQFKPYGLAIQLTVTDTSSVVLRDTGGNALKCNYVSVEASGENPDAFFRVAIDANSQTTPVANTTTTSSVLGVTTSGICGGYASVNKGIVELLLADTDRTDTLEVSLDENGACNFFITYGQIQAGNIMRDNERTPGV
jgi:hypothetical protein|tara:strand:- start:733 stop:1152 length:420 start_codon:yes stop_codon:yes gene_type:complete